jgi:hypothetical protein
MRPRKLMTLIAISTRQCLPLERQCGADSEAQRRAANLEQRSRSAANSPRPVIAAHPEGTRIEAYTTKDHAADFAIRIEVPIARGG